MSCAFARMLTALLTLIDSLQGKKIRADMLGWYVYKYSDDHGRYDIPREGHMLAGKLQRTVGDRRRVASRRERVGF